MPRIAPLLLASTIGLAAAGCVPSTTDDQGAVPEVQRGLADELQDAALFVGVPEDEALARAATQGLDARVGTAADVGQPGQTDDYEVGRLTFVVQDGVVAEVIVETETGPHTVAAS